MSNLMSFIFEPFKKVSDTNRFNEISSILVTDYVSNRLELKTWLKFNTDLNSHVLDKLYTDYDYYSERTRVAKYAKNPKDLFQKLTFVLKFLQTSISCIPGQIYNILALALDCALASIASLAHLAICLPLLLIKYLINTRNFETTSDSVQKIVTSYTSSILNLLQSLHDVIFKSLDAAAYVIATPLTPLAFGVIKAMGWNKAESSTPKPVTYCYDRRTSACGGVADIQGYCPPPSTTVATEPVPQVYVKLGAYER